MSRSRRLDRRVLALVASSALLATAACGSTVQNTGSGTVGSGADGSGALGGDGLGGDGLSAEQAGTPVGQLPPGAASLNQAAGASAGGITAGGVGGSPRQAGQSAPGANAPGSQPGTQGAPVNNAPGVTATTISIGFPYTPNYDKAQRSLGNETVTTGNPKQVAEALVKEINRTGGIAGRKLVAVFHEQDADSGETADQRSQALCETFTNDKKVLAVFGATSSLLRDCLRKAGVLNVSSTAGSLNESEFQASPNFYDVLGVTLDKGLRNLVRQLSVQSYFKPWDTSAGAPGVAPVKMGVLGPDSDSWLPVIKNVVLPELRAAGYPVDPKNVVYYKAGDPSDTVATTQGAVLKFRTEGVTHVLPLDTNSMVLFGGAAEKQEYRPRYGVTSITSVQGYAGTALLPYRQLRGALGIGWLPQVDIPESAQGTKYDGPGRKRCLDIMARAQITFNSLNAKGAALVICDEFFSLDATVESLPRGSAINVATFMFALERLGSFPIAGLPSGGWGPGRHYTITDAYPYAFSEKCPCMTYGQRFPLA